MSIQFSGDSFQLKRMDSARYIRQEHSFLRAVIGFFKGKSISHTDYLSLRKKNNSPKFLQKLYEAKKIHDRATKRTGVSIDEEKTVFGCEHDDSEMHAELKASRTNKDDFSDETYKIRTLQKTLFKLIKNRFKQKQLSLSVFDNKESCEILEYLEFLKIFKDHELGNIRKYLADELDSSPFWK